MRATRLSLITIDTYMNKANTPVVVPSPYSSLRNIATPPDEGNALDILTYEYALKLATTAATRNATGNRSPARAAA